MRAYATGANHYRVRLPLANGYASSHHGHRFTVRTNHVGTGDRRFCPPAAGSTLQPPSELHRSTRTEELRSFLFFTVVMAPLLAVVGVGGFGFLVWMYQLIAGPPAA